MKSLTLAILCAPLLLAGCGSPTPVASSTASSAPAAADETAAVHAAFDTYTKAALAKDGPAAQAALADTISTYYDDVRKQALTGSEAAVQALPVSQRLTVYVLRGEVEPAVLRDSKPADLVRVAIDKGLVGEQGISKVQLGKVTVTGDKAAAEVMADGKVAPYRIEFLREVGVWKLDLAPLMSLADEVFTEAAKQQNSTVDSMIDAILTAKYGAAKAAELKQPLDG